METIIHHMVDGLKNLFKRLTNWYYGGEEDDDKKSRNDSNKSKKK